MADFSACVRDDQIAVPATGGVSFQFTGDAVSPEATELERTQHTAVHGQRMLWPSEWAYISIPVQPVMITSLPPESP